MQELGLNLNDLPTRSPCPDSRGVSRSGATSSEADRGSAASAIPVDQEAGDKSEGSLDVILV